MWTLVVYTEKSHSTKALLIFLSGAAEVDRGTKQNHHGKYDFRGYNLHLWHLINSVVESQNKDPPKFVAKGVTSV